MTRSSEPKGGSYGSDEVDPPSEGAAEAASGVTTAVAATTRSAAVTRVATLRAHPNRGLTRRGSCTMVRPPPESADSPWISFDAVVRRWSGPGCEL